MSRRAGGSRIDPLYARVQSILARSIRNRKLKPGTVLLEGPLAEMLGSSRAPVRQALAALRREGLVSRFDGRGHIVGTVSAGVHRIEVSPDMLGLSDRHGLRKAFAWEQIYEAVERVIIHRSAFGRFEVNELELARHHRVGRGVARDVLTRIEGLGMLEKDRRQRWIIVPLDAERLGYLYEVRECLEPVALGQALPGLERSLLLDFRKRLVAQLEAYPRVSSAAMDDLEFDLHVRCLAPCPNPELLLALRKTRRVLTLSKHILGVTIDNPADEPFMGEHLRVLEAMLKRDADRAARALRRHLRRSRPKVIERLVAFRGNYTPPSIPYIG